MSTLSPRKRDGQGYNVHKGNKKIELSKRGQNRDVDYLLNAEVKEVIEVDPLKPSISKVSTVQDINAQ